MTRWSWLVPWILQIKRSSKTWTADHFLPWGRVEIYKARTKTGNQENNEKCNFQFTKSSAKKAAAMVSQATTSHAIILTKLIWSIWLGNSALTKVRKNKSLSCSKGWSYGLTTYAFGQSVYHSVKNCIDISHNGFRNIFSFWQRSNLLTWRIRKWKSSLRLLCSRNERSKYFYSVMSKIINQHWKSLNTCLESNYNFTDNTKL